QQDQRRQTGQAPVEKVEAEAGVVERAIARAGHGDPPSPSRDGSPPCVAWAPGARYRSDVISVGEALRSVLEAPPVLRTERVLLAAAGGRVVAEDVVSSRAVPADANSAMDGFAVRGDDVRTAGSTLRLIGSAPAGTPLAFPVQPGSAAKIFTGSVVPEGAD